MQIEQLGPYRIGPKLGKGGMGSVYQATDVKTGQRVAVKALAPQLAAAEGFRERFEAEIESLKKLQHDGIVRLYGYGEDNGILFYSMELVEGPSLEQEINSGRRFDWNETLSIAIQVCRALKHAHDHGVVHRDIKPANLLLAKGDKVKIADFGIARLFGATQLTSAGGILGTADYMSPEQVDGRPVTDRCDQYSLGCVMFALLSGRPPFRAKTMPEMLQLQRFAEPEPVRRYAPQTPEQLDRLIGQLLSKDPADRFPNVLVLGRHMEAMQRALSRPAKKDGGDAKQPTAYLADTDATAAPAMDATLAQDIELLHPLETTDSGVYDAPTLADDGQLELAAPESSSSAPSAIIAKSAPKAETKAPAAPQRENRFTTVDEARRVQRDRGERWLLGLQLAGLTAALAIMAWLGWRATRPATADALYATIEQSLADNNNDPTKVEDEVREFLERFPADSRAGAVQAQAEELELLQLQKKLRTRARLTNTASTLAAEQVYSDAMALVDADPARAAQMLSDLRALYGDAKETDPVQPYLELSRRQLEKLQATLDKVAAEQLPQLVARLRTAEQLEISNVKQAAAMYRALIGLYADEPWAAAVVDEAQGRLEAITESSSSKHGE
jgi:eukaryotic-like serine/threonine-protein kinase